MSAADGNTQTAPALDFEDPEVELDSFIISQILSNIVRSIPQRKPLFIPSFRIKDLIGKASSAYTGQTPDFLDAIGSLYCLCFYLATSPFFEEDRLVVECVLVLQTVAVECLYVLQSGIRSGMLSVKLSIAHPLDIFFRDNPPSLVDTLMSSFEVSKDIIRDIVSQIRSSHDGTVNEKKEEGTNKDSFMAHSVLFMCTFGLAHMGGVLLRRQSFTAIPGMLEFFLLSSLISLQNTGQQQQQRHSRTSATSASPLLSLSDSFPVSLSKSAKGQPQQQQAGTVDIMTTTTSTSLQKNEFNSRFEKCLELSRQLSLAVVSTAVSERVLEEIRLVRSRMLRRVSHPDVTYAQLATRTFRTFLDTAPPSVNASSPTRMLASKGALSPSSSSLTLFDVGALVSIGGKVYEQDMFDLSGEKMVTQRVGGPLDILDFEMGAFARLGGHSGESGLDSGDDAEGPTRGGSPHPSPDSTLFVEAKTMASPTGKTASTKIKKYLREAFLATEPLRNKYPSKKYFVAVTKPGKNGSVKPSSIAKGGKGGTSLTLTAVTTIKSGLNRLEIIQSVDWLERAYMEVDGLYTPRHLMPTCGIYWVVHHLLEYLFLRTADGQGFSREGMAGLHGLKAEWKGLKEMRLRAPLLLTRPLPTVGGSEVAAQDGHEDHLEDLLIARGLAEVMEGVAGSTDKDAEKAQKTVAAAQTSRTEKGGRLPGIGSPAVNLSAPTSPHKAAAVPSLGQTSATGKPARGGSGGGGGVGGDVGGGVGGGVGGTTPMLKLASKKTATAPSSAYSSPIADSAAAPASAVAAATAAAATVSSSSSRSPTTSPVQTVTKDPVYPALSLEEKLKLAALEARAESEVLAMERKLAKAAEDKRHERLLRTVDMTLDRGLRALTTIKINEGMATSPRGMGAMGGGIGGSSHRHSSSSSSMSGSRSGTVGEMRDSLSSSGSAGRAWSSRRISVQDRASPVEPALAKFLRDPAVREIEKFRTAIRRVGLIDRGDRDSAAMPRAETWKNMINTPVQGSGLLSLGQVAEEQKNAGDGKMAFVSPIWADGGLDEVVGKREQAMAATAATTTTKAKTTKGGAGKKQGSESTPLDDLDISLDVKRQYAAAILNYQRERREVEEEEELRVKYQYEKESKRAEERRQRDLQEQRERHKVELKAMMDARAQAEAKRRADLVARRREQKAKRKQDQDDAVRFREHIHEVKVAKDREALEEAKRHAHQVMEEAEKIRLIEVRLRDIEVLRQREEEERMRFLEEKRRVAERRKAEELAKKDEAKLLRKAHAVENVARAVVDVRTGAFEYVQGKLGFYKDVRAAPVPWVRFEHPDGKPIYFDPITNKTQRREPEDAPVVDADPGDVRWYSVCYGADAYAQYLADVAFKDAYNADQGYWDADGNWIVATGYYDENYLFVRYDGYYNEKGRYIPYPKPEGDLAFMV